MTRKDAKKKIELIKAFAEGKTIQFQENSGKWVDLENPDFANKAIYYRIKPEEEEWRPYKDCDEMVADFNERFNTAVPSHTMPLIWVKYKHINRTFLITGFDYEDNGICISNVRYDFEDVFAVYTYLDGSICGVKK